MWLHTEVSQRARPTILDYRGRHTWKLHHICWARLAPPPPWLKWLFGNQNLQCRLPSSRLFIGWCTSLCSCRSLKCRQSLKRRTLGSIVSPEHCIWMELATGLMVVLHQKEHFVNYVIIWYFFVSYDTYWVRSHSYIVSCNCDIAFVHTHCVKRVKNVTMHIKNFCDPLNIFNFCIVTQNIFGIAKQ